MNCHEAEQQIFSGGDSAAGREVAAGLAAHLTGCTACQGKREALAEAVAIWKTRTFSVVAPDPERAWSDLRRILRAGGAETARTSRLPAWLATPLAAAAALACMMILAPDAAIAPAGPEAGLVARAEFVEVPSRTASTVVYVDDESGWLVVWASDTAGTRI